MTPIDPFDADNPDNMPAYLWDQLALADAELYHPRHSVSEWRAIRDAASDYPREVGHDQSGRRLRLPVSFAEWQQVRTHPCWPEYVEQMWAVPAGTAIGFTAWMAGDDGVRGANGARMGPTRPFLCDPFTTLPAGWVRGDPASTDVARPYRQIAYDPGRHLVVRSFDAPSVATLDRFAAAGFEPFTRGDAEVTYFVRDRSIDRRRPVRQPAAAGRGRTP